MGIILCYSLFLIVISIILIKYIYNYKKKINNLEKIDKETEEKNKRISKDNLELTKEKCNLVEKVEHLSNESDRLQNLIKNTQETARKAYEQYCETLDEVYNNKDNEFKEYVRMLDKSYEQKQEKLNLEYITMKDKLNGELTNIKYDLDKLAQTRAAAIEAQRKEKIIKENKDKFRLNISDTQRNDVLVLNRVKKELSNPRILSMLIWQTYFRDYMTELCNDILGIKTICGIYKITNQITGACYIGQSVDVAKRWKDHAKCGLDIDRPQGNKLYQAMLEDGLWNFTFELLEECSKEDLDEKERFYINLYQSYEYRI